MLYIISSYNDFLDMSFVLTCQAAFVVISSNTSYKPEIEGLVKIRVDDHKYKEYDFKNQYPIYIDTNLKDLTKYLKSGNEVFDIKLANKRNVRPSTYFSLKGFTEAVDRLKKSCDANGQPFKN